MKHTASLRSAMPGTVHMTWQPGKQRRVSGGEYNQHPGTRVGRELTALPPRVIPVLEFNRLFQSPRPKSARFYQETVISAKVINLN